MDDVDGTKVPPKQHQPPPPNRILPMESEAENQRLLEHATKSEVPTSGDIEGTKRQEQAPLVNETVTTVTQKPERTIEAIIQASGWKEFGKYKEFTLIVNYKTNEFILYEDTFSIRYNRPNYSFQFPHGAEYRFFEDSDEKILIITYAENIASAKNGKIQINLKLKDEQLYQDLYMEWWSTKLFSDKKKIDRNNYSFTMNPPFSSEFGNVYNDKYMTYSPVGLGTYVENALVFNQKQRPNWMMTSSEKKCDEEIEKHMKERKILQWAPSRDWSRLFMLSVRKLEEDRQMMYIEFYDFNREEQYSLFFPKRINLLSQLLRPKWIQEIDQFDPKQPNISIEASFNCDYLAVCYKTNILYICDFNPNWTIASHSKIIIEGADIKNISFSFSKLMIQCQKDQENYYYEYNKNIEEIKDLMTKQLALNEDFSPKNYCNIIHCGVYDILFNKYEENVAIFNNQNQKYNLSDLKHRKLQSNYFIQLDYHSIARFSTNTMNTQKASIQITNIWEDCKAKFYHQDIDIILQSPWDKNNIYGSKWDLKKFKENQYVALIVTSPNQQGYFFQQYSWTKNIFKLQFQKYYEDIIPMLQIPHLPFVTLNGNLFINLDMYHNNNYLELDISDEYEIRNQDYENIYSQELDLYSSNFKKLLFEFIDEKQNITDKVIRPDQDYYSIQITEINALITFRYDAADSRIIVFQPSQRSIKQVNLENGMRYRTHKVIFRDSCYYLSIIIESCDFGFYEVLMQFNSSGVTINPTILIMKMLSCQQPFLCHLSDDLNTLSQLFIEPLQDSHIPSGYYFRQYSRDSIGNSWQEHSNIMRFLKYKEANLEILPDVIKIIQMVAQHQSLKIKSSILQDFASVIQMKTEIEINDITQVFALMDKIILFSPEQEDLKIFDSTLTMIGKVVFKVPILRIASTFDERIFECVDAFNYKFPFPILQNSNSKLAIEYQYSKNFRCLMPIQFGLDKNFFTHLDFKSEKLYFYRSIKEINQKNVFARIEVVAQRESFIDEINGSKERKFIEDYIEKTDINLLLSYNIYKRMNLITGVTNHELKEHIYSLLFKRLEIAVYKDLPILIYNISQDGSSYRSIIDVLIENKAIKLAQLIINIAIKQDQNGYIYNRLGPYLPNFSANDLQMFLGSKIFFFKISPRYYEEYQKYGETLIWPDSDSNSFSDIKTNIKDIESKNLPLDKRVKGDIPIEYYAINLMQLIASENQSHKEATQMMIKLVNIDATILERESIQMIIDFKWKSYARKFFSIQLFMLVCFIIAFIYDIVAVSKNQKAFENNDLSQIIPRIISILIIVPFGIYEIANIGADVKKNFKNFQNINDLLLVIVHTIYFIMAIAKPDYEYALKSLQLLIVIHCFIKFSFLIRIWTNISFLIKMVIVVFNELIIFLIYFLLVVGGLTVMAQIINKKSGEIYKDIQTASYFVTILREAIGDYDTQSIIEGTTEFIILAWLLWLLIMMIGNIIFMNFIIAVVSESYENCMEKKIQLIYQAKLDMIEECEDLMPGRFFEIKDWFPKFIIIRKEEGSSQGGENAEEWQGFVKQMKRHLERETNKLNDNINRYTDSTNQEVDDVKADIDGIKQILSAVFKDQVDSIFAKKVQAIKNKAN